MDVSIVIVNWNTRELLRRCLHSMVDGTSGVAVQTLVVDNGSQDGSAAMVAAEFPGVDLIRNAENEGFARANNQAYRMVRGRYVLLLNPDTELRPRVVCSMVDFLDADPARAGVTGVLRNLDGTLQRYHKRLPRWGYILFSETLLRSLVPANPWAREFYMTDESFDRVMEIEQPPAACLMLRRSVLDPDALFDERFPIFYNDVDLCRRLRDNGHLLYLLPEAEVLHHGGAGGVGAMPDRGVIDSLIGLVRYYRKHEGAAAALLLWLIFTLNSLAVLLGASVKVLFGYRTAQWWRHEAVKRIRLMFGREAFRYPRGIVSNQATGQKVCQH